MTDGQVGVILSVIANMHVKIVMRKVRAIFKMAEEIYTIDNKNVLAA